MTDWVKAELLAGKDERIAQTEAALPEWRSRVEELTAQVRKAHRERDQAKAEREDFGHTMDLAVEREETERAEALRQQQKALREGWRANDAEKERDELRQDLDRLLGAVKEHKQAADRVFGDPVNPDPRRLYKLAQEIEDRKEQNDG